MTILYILIMKPTTFNTLEEKLEYINSRTATELASSSNAELICREGISRCEDLKEYIKLLNKFPDIYELPERVILNLSKQIQPILDEITRFNNHEKNPSSSDESQLRSIREYFTYERDHSFYKHFNALASTISEAMLFAETDIKQKDKRLNDAIERAEKASDKLEGMYSGRASEAVEDGVASHASIFSAQAVKNIKRADQWRNAALWEFGGLIVFALTMFFIYKNDYSVPLTVAVFSGLIVAILFYSITICVKNFFGEMHNYTVNKHKANCLNTFKTLIETADKDNTQTILKLATEAIFSHQNTGYLKRESGTGSPSPIIELIKSAPQRNAT